MASTHYGHLPDFETSPWEEIPCQPFSNELPVNVNELYPFLQLQPEFVPYGFPSPFNWASSFPALSQYMETSSPSDPSSNSPPSSLNDVIVGDAHLAHEVSSSLKRKPTPVDGNSASKRPKCANGYAQPLDTAMNRRTGACLSCQMRTKKRCCKPGPDPDGPCEACCKKANAVGPLICRRARFQDIKIIRLGPSRDFANTLRWLKDIKAPQDPQKAEWKRLTNIKSTVKKSWHRSPGYIELRLSQGHSRSTLNLRVQDFDPVESDRTDYPWFDGEGVEHVYTCPHFAIADREHATDQVRRFIDANLAHYVHNLLPVTNDPSAKFVRMVFQNALARARESSLIALTIRFWVAGRLIEDPWGIQGDETLGMGLDPLPASPFSQRIPVTPIMDFQIDNIVIYDYLMGMLDRIRQAMKEKIMPIKKEDWFEIHLATFILLHHVDLTMKHDVDFAKIRCPSKRFSNRPLIEMVTFGANALLSFHQYEEGHFPLSAHKWAEVERGHEFSESQRSYLLEARRLIQQIDIPCRAGDDLFWTSQIYDRTWQPTLVEAV